MTYITPTTTADEIEIKIHAENPFGFNDSPTVSVPNKRCQSTYN